MIQVGEPNDYAAEILFYLPQAGNPLEPKLAHVFSLGEVQIKLNPGDPWTDVPVGPGGRVVERGRGWYAIRLTAGQRAAATVVAYQAVCAGAEPDRGTETIGELAGDIAQGGSGIVPFYLADVVDPSGAPPIEGHVFTLGEVELSLPDDAFGTVDPTSIVEYGGGMYGVVIAPAQTTKRGKAIVVADVAVAQRFSIARTIAGEGSTLPSWPMLPMPAPAPGSTTVAGDLALGWSNTSGDGDVALVANLAGEATDLSSDRGLMTAVVLSLFTDRRAEPDDVPPSGDPNDRRGWWGDQFAEVEGDRIGSRLWLLDRAKRTNETALRAKEYSREALAWMLEDRVVTRVDVDVTMTAVALQIAIGLHRPGRDPVNFRFAQRWDHMQEST